MPSSLACSQKVPADGHEGAAVAASTRSCTSPPSRFYAAGNNSGNLAQKLDHSVAVVGGKLSFGRGRLAHENLSQAKYGSGC
jgi:hypothetical protein